MTKPAAYVYLLQDATNDTFKIGAAADVAERSRALVDRVDLARSLQAPFPSLGSALRVEKLLHRMLSGHRAPRRHKQTGYTEWYYGSARPLVEDFLQSKSTQSLFQCGPLRPVPHSVKPELTAEQVAARNLAQAQRRQARTDELAVRNADTIARVLDALNKLDQAGRIVGLVGCELVVAGDVIDELQDLIARASLDAAAGMTKIFGNALYAQGCTQIFCNLLSADQAEHLDAYNPPAAVRELLSRLRSFAQSAGSQELQDPDLVFSTCWSKILSAEAVKLLNAATPEPVGRTHLPAPEARFSTK